MFALLCFVLATLISPFSHSFQFAGRRIQETFPNPSTDNCYYPNNPLYLPWTAQAAPSHVLDTSQNNSYTDQIGIPPEYVAGYRRLRRAPCNFSVSQKMEIDCNGDSRVIFKTNALIIGIGKTTVSSARAGYTQTETYGTPQDAYSGSFLGFIKSLLF